MLEPRDTSSPEPGSLFRSPLALFSVCALTFIASAIFLSGFHLQGMTFWVSGKVRLWHMLLALSPTLWVTSVLVMFHEWRTTRILGSGSRRQRLVTGASVVLATFMFVAPTVTSFLSAQSAIWVIQRRADDLIFLPGFPPKFFLLNLLRDAVVLLLISGMVGAHAQLLGQFPRAAPGREEAGAERLAEDLGRYQQLRSRLERFLGFAAANIGLSILSFGALRSMLGETAAGLPELLPKGSILVFGAYFTWLLAIIYLPIRKSLNDVGNALAEEVLQQPVVKRVTWTQWLDEQQAIRTWLGLQGSVLQDLQQGLSVLAPLLAGITSLALGA